MFFDTEKDDEDLVDETAGVPVVVDPSSAQLLSGATLDYKDGLQGAGFAIDNPNAQKHLRLRPVLQLIARRCGGDATEIIPTAASGRPSSRAARPGRFVPLWLTWSGHA